MRIGVILPSFATDASQAIAVARDAEELGVHGAFCYDHLWPLGEPGRPAISPYPLLGTLCELTDTITLGTLASRVGLVPEDVLFGELRTLHLLSRGRFIATLGTGDRKSADENLAYGVPFTDAADRRAEVSRLAQRLSVAGIEVWIAGGSAETSAIAVECKSALNLWGAPSAAVAARKARTLSVTWAGLLPSVPKRAVQHLSALRDAGADWAVYIWQESLEPIVHAATGAGIALGR